MSLVKNYHNAGFSLIELVAVLLVLGIIAVVAIGRLADQDGPAARGFFDDTVTAVRFAQKLAVSTGCEVRVVTTATSYQLRQSSTCTAGDFVNTVQNPANRDQVYQNVNMPPGFSLTAGNITFNSRGTRDESAPSAFTLTDGSTVYTFNVFESTGLVNVN